MASVGVSSSVAVFLLLTSVCCILSLSSIDQDRDAGTHGGGGGVDGGGEPTKLVTVPKYVPNLAMSVVMATGIVAMAVLICRLDDLTTPEDVDQMSHHRALHRKYSLRGVVAFFVVGSFLHLNYLIVEATCRDKWTLAHCEYTFANVSELLLHSLCIAFAFFETVVCWIMNLRSFEPSQWVWHGLAVVQAANVAVWFDFVLREAYHRIHENSESLDSYFSFCNATTTPPVVDNETHWCGDSSTAAVWFIKSIPFLFPITIEFALLVSETLLDRVVGGAGNGNDHNRDAGQDAGGPAADDAADERAPLLQRTLSSYTNSRRSKIFVLMSVFISIVYFVLTILVFVCYKLRDRPGIEIQLQTYDDVFTVYSVFHDIFSVICCAVGILSCRSFRRPHVHTSFLEYFLLLATSGVLLQSMKRIVAFVTNAHSETSIFAFFVACGVLDIIQSLLQIVFYYFAKDVKLKIFDDDGQADSASSVTVFKTILVVVSVSNVAMWLSDSFLIPEILPGLTPSNYVTEVWPVFDNVVTPITIFFRFNSAILFWCIGTDYFKAGELHQD